MQRAQLDCWYGFLGPITENVLIMPNKKKHPKLNICVMKSANDSMGILLIQFQIRDFKVFTCLTEESGFEFC